jgi:hypothetical protein
MPYTYTHTQTVTGVEGETLTAGKETVVVELVGVDLGRTNSIVQLEANVPITTVAESTSIVVRIRRTKLTGTEVAKVQSKPGASTEALVTLNAQDAPGEVAGMVYVLTVEDVAKKESKVNKPTLTALF